MDHYDSIGSLIKWIIKCRNKTITETAEAMHIKKTTFSAQLINNTVSADTLFKLAAYLDLDLEWMEYVLGYHGTVGSMERETIPRMQESFRNKELKIVYRELDRILKENPSSTPDARRELLSSFGKNMFYLLDVLIPEEYNIYMSSERGGKTIFYVDIPTPTRVRHSQAMRRKSFNVLFEGSKVLDRVIEERKTLK